MKWWQSILVNSVMFLALAGFFSGFIIDSVVTAIFAAVLFGALNALIKPILVLFSLPLTFLTLGFFYFIINGFILYLTSALIPGFVITSFWLAFFLALIISFVNSMFSRPRVHY